jgi:hypothetical protein
MAVFKDVKLCSLVDIDQCLKCETFSNIYKTMWCNIAENSCFLVVRVEINQSSTRIT